MSAGVTIEFRGDASSAVTAANEAEGAIRRVGGGATTAAGQLVTRIMNMGASFSMMGISAVMAYDMASAYGSRYAMMQERIQIAQENVTKALMNYGAGSIQVIQAQQQLKAVTDESKYAQGEYNREMLMMSAMIVPQMMTMFPRLVTALQTYTAAAGAATTATTALDAAMMPLIGAGIGIVAMIALMAYAGATTGPGAGGTSYTQYGDTYIQGNPFQYGTSVQAWTQAFRG